MFDQSSFISFMRLMATSCNQAVRASRGRNCPLWTVFFRSRGARKNNGIHNRESQMSSMVSVRKLLKADNNTVQSAFCLFSRSVHPLIGRFIEPMPDRASNLFCLLHTSFINPFPVASKVMDYNVHVRNRSDVSGSMRLSMEVVMVIAAFVGFAVVLALAAKMF